MNTNPAPAPAGTLADLAARGYITDDWARWQQGGCGVYAVALTHAVPGLRFATLYDADNVETHHVAHDDTHAYDSAGAHPLPYLGLSPEPGATIELDEDPSDYGLTPDGMPDFWPALTDAIAHAIRHRIHPALACHGLERAPEQD